MIKRLGVLAFVLCASTGALVACGGDSDEDEVREVAQQFLDADSDVCGKFTDAYLKQLFDDQEDCEKQAGEESAAIDADIESVEIDGDEAKVKVDPKEGESGTITLVKEDGDWVISKVAEE